MKLFDNSPRELILARFAGPRELMKAAELMRNTAFTKFDCHSPFPIHGMDQAMGLGRSPIGYIVATMGTIGLIGAMTLQWWTSTVDYRIVISGTLDPIATISPVNSWPNTVLAGAMNGPSREAWISVPQMPQ